MPREVRRALRWQRNKGKGVPPRHIARVLGWKYVRQPNGQVLHVPRSA